MRLISNEKEELFWGIEDDFYTYISKIQIKEDEYLIFNAYKIPDSFFELESVIGLDSVKDIAEQSDFTRIDYTDKVFKGKYNMGVSYIYKNKYLVLFSSGEAYRGNYMIYKEAIWHAPDLNIPETELIKQKNDR